MAITNCNDCKWRRLAGSPSECARLGVSAEDIRTACDACVKEFAEHCRANVVVCVTCPWKDRNLPYESRMRHCKACAEAFAERQGGKCDGCPWNNPNRPMPSDAAMLHCKTCLGGGSGGAMNCTSCKWMNRPKEVRMRHCAACSLKFSGNSKVVGSTNELSNKGQVFESYDNHNPAMTDDRDSVMKLRRDYVETRKSLSKPGCPHPVLEVAERGGMTIEEFAENSYEMSKRFVYELSSLPDLHALLFLSTIRGESKSEFARAHGIKDSAVNTLFKQLLVTSETFKTFILLSRGSVKGTRGRKAKDPAASLANVPRKMRHNQYCGVMQMSLGM